MRSRCVGLVTEDPALYADLAAALRDRRIPSVSIWPGDRIPERVAVVLTSPGEARRIGHPKVLAVAPDADRAALWAAVESALRPERPAEIAVGIDPGPRPGYAVVTAERTLVEGVLDSPEQARSLAEGLASRFPGRAFRFRIGSGDPPFRNRVLVALDPSARRVELVDEHDTSPRVARRHRDAAAARAIARLPGRRVLRPPELRATRGALIQVQRLSRQDSGGRISISRALADRVLKGDLSLSQALAASVPPPGPRESPGRRLHPPRDSFG